MGSTRGAPRIVAAGRGGWSLALPCMAATMWPARESARYAKMAVQGL
ncbi:MAG: hypothetical protein H6638_06295 [Ardenticatenales bacterium]|nr:hypothetical protein [Ardenticatenales bacterium]